MTADLGFQLGAAHRAVVAAYAPVLEPHQLTHPQYLVLLVLSEATMPASVSELAGYMSLDPATVTPIVQKLHARGFLTKEPDSADGRRTMVQITSDGALTVRCVRRDAPTDARVLPQSTVRMLLADLGLLVGAT
ncbi:MarR family winged helix-turn-helix transcriptional regulator [Clavibacter michiganensis]|uniref:MarR family winged helix-turn-helix transcriptional regulator n=1 Tax=Clavibacter michiganensis TaxID=28447 RepID=UPI001C6529BA|nr:MarR family transcriptional regulator [Clavibacter michiganensis]